MYCGSNVAAIRSPHVSELVVPVAISTAAISDWPAITLCGQLDAAIQGLYRTHLPFPPSWTPDEHEEFIKEHADTDAQQLATQFDDTIDTEEARVRQDRPPPLPPGPLTRAHAAARR